MHHDCHECNKKVWREWTPLSDSSSCWKKAGAEPVLWHLKVMLWVYGVDDCEVVWGQSSPTERRCEPWDCELIECHVPINEQHVQWQVRCFEEFLKTSYDMDRIWCGFAPLEHRIVCFESLYQKPWRFNGVEVGQKAYTLWTKGWWACSLRLSYLIHKSNKWESITNSSNQTTYQ